MSISRTICLGFLAVIAIGTILLMLPFSMSGGTWNAPIVALFTSTSAVCVTGLSIVDIGTYFSFWGQLVILVLMQVGGLGYVTATTFLLLVLGHKFGLRDRIAIQQALDNPGIYDGAQLVRAIITITIIFEIIGIFLLAFIFVPDYGFSQGLWLAIFHSVSAWTNASFSLFKDSLIHYQTSIYLNVVITLLVIFGGIGYEVILEGYLRLRNLFLKNKEPFVFSLNYQVATSTAIILLIIGTVAFAIVEYNNQIQELNLFYKTMVAFFLSVSVRTGGFNTINIGEMNQASLFIAIALMFVGASPGSMGGGIKTTTFRVLISSTQAILQGKEQVLMYGRQIPISLILKSIGVVVGSLGVITLSTILIALFDMELNFLQIFFEVVSAFSTTGLSTGITSTLSTSAKLVLIVTMYIGRVGVLLLMSAISSNESQNLVEYPEENLLVG